MLNPFPNNMKSNDEDFTLFLEEFGRILNKYHYTIDAKFIIKKINDPSIVVAGFTADGYEVWPEYAQFRKPA